MTLLSLKDVWTWPDGLFSAPFWSQHKLQVLHIKFDSSLPGPSNPIVLTPTCCLKELYLTESHAGLYDLAACTSLTTLAIWHPDLSRAILIPPPTLLRIDLVSSVGTIAMPCLQPCSGLTHVLLRCGSTHGEDNRQLLALPQTVTHLALGDCHDVCLQELTRLTNLRQLRICQIPTRQQLLIIKQLPQLRDLEGNTPFAHVVVWSVYHVCLPQSAFVYALLTSYAQLT